MINADQTTAGLLIASIFALEGVPPFNLFLSKIDVIKTLFQANIWLALFTAIEWVIAFIIFLRVIHTYAISEGEPEVKRKLPVSVAFSVRLLLILSLASQFVCNYIWTRW